MTLFLRQHSDGGAELTRQEQAGTGFMGEHELALGMTRHIVETMERKGVP